MSSGLINDLEQTHPLVRLVGLLEAAYDETTGVAWTLPPDELADLAGRVARVEQPWLCLGAGVVG